jgi:hypothetical protein
MEYLKFFLGLLTAVVALGAAYISRSSTPRFDDRFYYALLAVVYILTAVATITYLAIRKLRYSLDHYRAVLQRIRILYLPDGKRLNDSVWVDRRRKQIPRLFSIQDGAEVLLQGCLVLFDAAALLIFALMVQTDGYPVILEAVSSLPALVAIAFHAYIAVVQARIGRTPEPLIEVDVD